jgi:hypothetical protein
LIKAAEACLLKVNFPPETDREQEIESLLNVLGSVIVGRAAVYVSTPITSGRRFVDWSRRRNLETDLSHPATHKEFVREVLEPNNEHARTIIKKLRSIFPQALIDPTALKDIEGWSQDDYRALWAKVIEQYAGTVVFLDGWEYSNGCAYEFLIANRLHPQPSILNETLAPLTLEAGTRLVQSAILELQDSKFPTDFLQRVLNELGKLHALEEVLAEA